MQQALINTAKQRIKAMGSNDCNRIIGDLKSSCADKAVVAEIEAEINKASNKNQAILKILDGGGKAAIIILRILKLC